MASRCALVNVKCCFIFNGVFGMQISARKGENFAQMRAIEHRGFAFTAFVLSITAFCRKEAVR
jgi:hypothetical protein